MNAVPAKRVLVGQEVGGEKGTPHLQGAIIFAHAHRMDKVVAMLKGPRWSTADGYPRVAPMAGKWEDQDYCAKDGVILRMEDNSHQGSRTDLGEFTAAMKRKAPDMELIEKHMPVLAKYPRLESRLRTAFAKARSREFRKVECTVYYGDGGAGKSKVAIYNPDGTRADNYIVPKTENLKWFLDYQGEDTIVFNDFYGSCKWTRFLDLLDGHQMPLENKGGHCYAEWTKVIITSNKHPDDWYEKHSIYEKEFNRRITKLIYLHEDQEHDVTSTMFLGAAPRPEASRATRS